MEKRTFTFIVATTIVFVGLVVIQTIFFPPQGENGQNRDSAKQKAAELGEGELAAKAQEEKAQDGGQETKTETEQPDNSVESGETIDSGDKTDQANKEHQDAAELAAEVLNAAIQDEENRRFVTIGSQAVDSPFQLLVCLDTRGATVRWAELVSRRRNGQLRYRDVEDRSGYIGELELMPVEMGLRVRVVGTGTPAARAQSATSEPGLQVDDIITHFNGEPVFDVDRFAKLIGDTRPKDRIELSVRRTSETGVETSHDFAATATRRPMRVIRPTPIELLPADEPERLAFLVVLKQQQMGDWSDLDPDMRTANWNVNVLDNDEGRVVEFSYQLAATEDRGALEIVKRFSLPTHEAGTAFDRSFHINMEIEILNQSDQAQTVSYELIGPTGTPVEGWWYQQKIHGSAWAIGRMAGARDIVTSTNAIPFQFTSGPSIVSNVDRDDPFFTYLIDRGGEPDAHRLRFLGVDTLYFNAALLPADEGFSCYSAIGFPSTSIPEKKFEKKTVDISFMMFSEAIELPPSPAGGQPVSHVDSFQIFVGPKEPELLDTYGLQDTRTFGWFALFSRPLIWLLHLFHSLTLGASYGLAIILLTVLVRCCMIPISRKAALNAQMMQHLQPEIKQIAERYKDDMEKRAQAQRELFAKYKYNPFGGCLLMFLQLPIFIGLYRGLSVDIALRDQPLIPGMSWCSNLAGPDQLMRWDSWMPAFLASESGWLGPYLNILPIITIVLFLMQQKLFMPPATDDQQKLAQRMMTFMMLFMGVIFFKVPSGLCVYFITSSVWGIIERKLLPKPTLANPLEAKGDGKNSKKAKAEPVTLALRNEEELENRRRRDRERKRKLKERK